MIRRQESLGPKSLPPGPPWEAGGRDREGAVEDGKALPGNRKIFCEGMGIQSYEHDRCPEGTDRQAQQGDANAERPGQRPDKCRLRRLA